MHCSTPNLAFSSYFRLFGVSGACSACGQNIPPSEFVMRAATLSPDQHQHHLDYVYHVKCFSCTKCQNRLVPGDRYALIGGSLVCEQDCQKLLKNNSLPTSVRRGKVGRPRRAKEWFCQLANFVILNFLKIKRLFLQFFLSQTYQLFFIFLHSELPKEGT